MKLVACTQCRRHVDVNNTACPFCGCEVVRGELGPSRIAAGRLSRAAIFAGATLGATASCWTSSQPAPQERFVDATSARGSIRGKVIQRNGQLPWNGAWIGLTGPGGLKREGETDMQGGFVFDGLPAGRYKLHTKVPDYSYNRRRARFGDEGDPDAGSQKVSYDVELAEGAKQDVVWQLDIPEPEPYPMDMPYGAPPARRRVV